MDWRIDHPEYATLSLWTELEDISHYGNNSNKTFYHLVNR